jgi:hypothetical protein
LNGIIKKKIKYQPISQTLKQLFSNNRLSKEVFIFPQILRLPLKIREECAPGKIHFGFPETQLARRIVQHTGEIRKTDGMSSSDCNIAQRSSTVGAKLGGAVPSPGQWLYPTYAG